MTSGSTSKKNRQKEETFLANKTVTSSAAKAPKPGNSLTINDLEMILEAVQTRQRNFPSEPASMSFILVMMNIGDRFAPVTCVEGEWEGLKVDIPKGTDIPQCPNGHVLIQGDGLCIGWIKRNEGG